MPEHIHDKKIFSLLEVTLSIQKTLSGRYKSSFWVKAEMSKLNYYSHSGHCYPDLVEKKDGKVIAQLRSTLWKEDYLRINENFLKVVRGPLKDGINMLFCAKITFDPTHGLALRIIDIDPAFSLGELEREKQETIERLKKEDIFTKNKSLRFPLLPQRIAIISVQTSKGYADFLKVIDENARGYKFFHILFPSLLQGEKAVESIRYQLDKIKKVISHFDVVAIVRGGGGEVGLSCFNDFELSKQIALFPIPVLTGIGHATNETVAEMIAFKNAITPTDLADYLLQKFHDFSFPVRRAEEKLREKPGRIVREEKLKFHTMAKYFRSVTGNILIHNVHTIRNYLKALLQQSQWRFLKEKEAQIAALYTIRGGSLALCQGQRQNLKQTRLSFGKELTSTLKQKTSELETIEKSIGNMRPENVLKRGYSITTIHGKAVKSYQDVKENDIINTLLIDGSITSKVKSTGKPEKT